MQIETTIINSGYDRITCLVHARPGVIPGNPPVGLVTASPSRISGDDVFYAIQEIRSEDGGKTWGKPQNTSLSRRNLPSGNDEGICDFWPKFHAASGKLLGTGHTVRYYKDNLSPLPRPRQTAYSVYDSVNKNWNPWRTLEFPKELADYFISEGAGSTQRYDMPDGTILLPTYFVSDPAKATSIATMHEQLISTVLQCAFDGETLTYIRHGNELYSPDKPGLCEPSITFSSGRFYITLRNDFNGYVATSDDGLHYTQPRRWTFDDGSNLGSYNTQQHWLAHQDELFLIYTRSGANNDHIPRNRAPLFMAQVDKERLCVIRDSECILMPERGAKLGNFGVAQFSDREYWVADAEWMQTKSPDYANCRKCEERGSDNAVFLTKVTF